MPPTVVLTDLVFPAQTNYFGTMFGGHVMAMMDKAAVLAAIRYSRLAFVTISSDSIQFLTPIHQGDIIEARARVAWTGNTSLIVKVEVYREDRFGDHRHLCTVGWFALAARGRDGKKAQVPSFIPTTDQERADHDHAAQFRVRSLQRACQEGQEYAADTMNPPPR